MQIHKDFLSIVFPLTYISPGSKNLEELEGPVSTTNSPSLISLPLPSVSFPYDNFMLSESCDDKRGIYGWVLWVQEQERVDDYMEMRECLELSNINFQESLVAWTSPDRLPWFARNKVFWFFSFLLLSWPIRILLELNTAHLHYKVYVQSSSSDSLNLFLEGLWSTAMKILSDFTL